MVGWGPKKDVTVDIDQSDPFFPVAGGGERGCFWPFSWVLKVEADLMDSTFRKRRPPGKKGDLTSDRQHCYLS